jgi:Predicted GTPase, probable translation factor
MNSNYTATIPVAATATAVIPKRKILVLHGDRQTGQLLLGRIASLKRKLQKKPTTRRRQEDGNPHEKKKTKEKEGEEFFFLDEEKNNHGIELVAPDGPFVWQPQQQQQQQIHSRNREQQQQEDEKLPQDVSSSNSDDSRISRKNDNSPLESHPQTTRSSSDDLLMRTWWRWRHKEEPNHKKEEEINSNKKHKMGGEKLLYHEGLEESLEMLLNIWNDGGNNHNTEFEGILGFSRGARLAHFIACLHQASGGRLFSKLKYVVIVSGYGHVPMPENFPPRGEPWDEYLASCTTNDDTFPLNNIPSMHIMGRKDRLITLENSRALLPCYVDPVVYEHEGGHHVPMRAADVRAIVDFIDSACCSSDNSSRNRVTVATEVPLKNVENMTGNIGCIDDDKEVQSCPVLDHHHCQNITLPDEEHALIQQEECESMSMIFPNEFQLLSTMIQKQQQQTTATEPLTSSLDTAAMDEFGNESITMECQYDHPISYSVQLRPSAEELEQQDPEGTANKLWPVKEIALKVEYTAEYPDALPKFSLVHDMNLLEFKLCQEEACLEAVKKVAEAELGMPCMMSCVYAAREFFEGGGLLAALVRGEDGRNEQREKDTQEQDEEESVPSNIPILARASEERRSHCIQEGLEIAYSILGYKECHGKDIGYGFENLCTGGKGGSWKFTIGLVGKPSAGKKMNSSYLSIYCPGKDEDNFTKHIVLAGKSTFFNAATAFARQRGGDEVDGDGIAIGGAAMAPHPFTTIDPNVGYCLVPAPPGSCPEDDCEGGAPFVACTHGRDSNGRRLIPVLLKDVAGLVPGAYKGRGRGNKVRIFSNIYLKQILTAAFV